MSILGAIAGTVLPKLAGGLVGKLFGGGKTTTSRTNFKQLRDDAKAAGYNPLTALRATGGGGNVTTTQPSLSTGEFIAEAVERGTETWFNRAQIARDAEVEEIKVATMRAELENLQNRNGAPSASQSFGYSIPTAATVGPRSEDGLAPALNDSPWPSAGGGRPTLRPTQESARRIPVFAPDGSQFMMPKHVANRLQLNAFDYILAGDWAELKGEIAGEGETLLNTGPIGRAVGAGGLWGNAGDLDPPALSSAHSPRRRSSSFIKPYGVSGYGS